MTNSQLESHKVVQHIGKSIYDTTKVNSANWNTQATFNKTELAKQMKSTRTYKAEDLKQSDINEICKNEYVNMKRKS